MPIATRIEARSLRSREVVRRSEEPASHKPIATTSLPATYICKQPGVDASRRRASSVRVLVEGAIRTVARIRLPRTRDLETVRAQLQRRVDQTYTEATELGRTGLDVRRQEPSPRIEECAAATSCLRSSGSSPAHGRAGEARRDTSRGGSGDGVGCC
jgi:hypothetical protein